MPAAKQPRSLNLHNRAQLARCRRHLQDHASFQVRKRIVFSNKRARLRLKHNMAHASCTICCNNNNHRVILRHNRRRAVAKRDLAHTAASTTKTLASNGHQRALLAAARRHARNRAFSHVFKSAAPDNGCPVRRHNTHVPDSRRARPCADPNKRVVAAHNRRVDPSKRHRAHARRSAQQARSSNIDVRAVLPVPGSHAGNLPALNIAPCIILHHNRACARRQYDVLQPCRIRRLCHNNHLVVAGRHNGRLHTSKLHR